ncbi:MAG: protein-export chaperone SecB [Proteobacteria bacterium]|jgi:preprotein translocase subunit SecB|nr:protein-export chaperone SecB [Pseudomonadota bacterium]MDA1298762.1 protein-export chaperone SecB [Pseudomonadota bacterium]
MSEQSGSQFSLQRIYIKDASFESPQSPHGFREKWKPRVSLELNSRHSNIDENLFEVVLHITVTARTEDDKPMYLVEVQQAGIFLVAGMELEIRDQTLGSYCPNVLFPYAREALDALVLKGSFPPLLLAPVNFDAIYQQTQAERAKQRGELQ